MKMFLVVGLLAFLCGGAHAERIWLSSNTATSTGITNTSVNMLCTQTQRGIFHGICTNFGVAAASTTIVNSTWTISGVKAIGAITTLVADQCKYYDTVLGNGMGYYKPNTANVTILYDCY